MKHRDRMMKHINKIVREHATFPKHCEPWTSPVTWDVAKEFPWDDELHAKMDCVARRMQDRNLPPALEKKLGEGTYGSVYVMAGIFTAKVPTIHYVSTEGSTDPKVVQEVTQENEDLWEEALFDSMLEFITGLKLNSVPTPNFIKTYAHLQIKGGDSKKRPGSFHPTPVIIQERVEGEALFKWLQKNQTLRDLIGVWMQIVYSLQLAGETYGGYSHNDLHGNNVMVQKLPQEIQIPYPLKSGTRYLKTRYLVKILDYGMTTVGTGAKATGAFTEDRVFRHNDQHQPLYYVGGTDVQTYPYDLARLEYWKYSGEDDRLQAVLGNIPRMHSILDDKPRNQAGKTYRAGGQTDVLRAHLYSQDEISAFMKTWREMKYIKGMEEENRKLGEVGAELSMKPFEGVTLGSCNPTLVKKAGAPTKCAQPQKGWLNKEVISWK